MSARTRPYPQLTDWPASKELFSNPPEDFRPAAYWFWSQDVNPDTFRTKLEQMQASGIHSLFIQPRLGFPIEKFLSQEYFELYKQALEIAIELEINVGIYDDYNWITGHAAGKTVAENDAFRESHTFWVEVPLKKGVPQSEIKISGVRNLLTEGHKEGLTWLYDGEEIAWDNWQILGAYSYKRDQVVETDTVTQVTNNLVIDESSNGVCKLAVEGKLDSEATHLLVFVTAHSKTSKMIDYLSLEAVEAFIRVAYEPYYKELEPYWEHIWAMFFDEPYSGLYIWDQMQGVLGTSLMYNPELYEEFEMLKGYDIKEHLYALLWSTDTSTTKYKNDFFEVYANRVQRVFFEPLKQWSHEKNVLFVGHELMTQLNGHWAFTTNSGFDVVANFGADHFGIGELKDVSIVDSGTFDKNIAAKLGSSVAHVYRKNGSMLEQYSPAFETEENLPSARGDWNLTAQTLKRQMDFYAVQGLTQFLWHGFFQSNDVVGEDVALYSQKFDFPPGINYEPWFRYFKQLSDMNGRLAYFLSLGTHLAPAAVLYPLRTYWSEGREALFSSEGAFYNEYLTRLHCDYDFIDERNLLDAELEQGKIKIGEESYSLLVLPAVTTLQNEEIVKVIEQFAKEGGAIIFGGAIPRETHEDQLEIVQRLQDLCAQYERVIFLEDPLSKTDKGIEILENTLDELAVKTLSITEEREEDLGTLYCLREDQENYYLAIVNDEEREKNIEIRLPSVEGSVELWNLETGESINWPVVRYHAGGMVISYTLDPIEAACFKISRNKKTDITLTSLTGKFLDSSISPNELSMQIQVSKDESLKLDIEGFLDGGLDLVQVKENGKKVDFESSLVNGELKLEVPYKNLPKAYKCSSEWQLTLEDGTTKPITDDKGWEEQGLESYSGGATYIQELNLPKELAGIPLKLVPTNACHTMEVKLNGKEVGTKVWAPYDIALGKIESGNNLLEIFVTNTAGNEMYHQTKYDVNKKAKSGLIGPVTLEPYRIFDITIRKEG